VYRENNVMDTSDVIMPFGKHKGKKLSEIPVEYMDWLIGQDWLKWFAQGDLRNSIEEYLEGCAEWQRMRQDDE